MQDRVETNVPGGGPLPFYPGLAARMMERIRRTMLRLLGGVPRKDWRHAIAERDMNVEARRQVYYRIVDQDGEFVQNGTINVGHLPDGRDVYRIRLKGKR